MGLKTPKPHSDLSKNIVFYTKFNSAQQNELYALIQVIHLHPYLINIISDFSYSVFVLKNIKTSTIVLINLLFNNFFLNYNLFLGTTLPPFHTLKLQIEKILKEEYTGTILSSLSRADSTRFQTQDIL